MIVASANIGHYDQYAVLKRSQKLKPCRNTPVLWVTEQGEDAKRRFGKPGVKILTLHSAKGLQFNAVVVIFANDCPADFSDTTPEEERCLFYVALKRAEDYLAVSCSGKVGFGAEVNEAGADGHPEPS